LESSVDSPAGLQDAAEPVAEGVAAVHIDVEQMEVHEEGMSSRGMSSGRETRRERGEEWEWNLNFSGDLWNQLDGAKETNSVSDCCLFVLLNCLSVISDGFAP